MKINPRLRSRRCFLAQTLGAAALARGETERESPQPERVTLSNGTRIGVWPNGPFRVTTGPGWTFSGTLGCPLENIRVTERRDGEPYTEIVFDYLANEPRRGTIRAYERSPVVLFGTTNIEAISNSNRFPRFTEYPRDLFQYGYHGLWEYGYGIPDQKSPWVLFDRDGNTAVLSHLTHPMVAGTLRRADGSIEAGIDPALSKLPAGFTQQVILVCDSGIGRTLELWGNTLRNWYRTPWRSNDDHVLLSQPSLWTDATSPWWYFSSNARDYIPKLLAVQKAYRAAGVEFGSAEGDSWIYPKGPNAEWYGQDGERARGGMYDYIVEEKIFPEGLGAFQRQLGIPLIVHKRWIEQEGRIGRRWGLSGGLIKSRDYCREYVRYLKANGVIGVEQDWLAGRAQEEYGLDAGAFLDNLANEVDEPEEPTKGERRARNNEFIQIYCMSTNAHYIKAAQHRSARIVRTSNDGFSRARWDEMIHYGHLAKSLNLWPFADGFKSRDPMDVVLALQAGGPWAPRDDLDEINRATLSKALRKDSRLIKPDSSIVPTDRTYLAEARNRLAPMVAYNFTDHRMRYAYIVAYSKQPDAFDAVIFSPADAGIAQPAFVYNWFTGEGELASAGKDVQKTAGYRGSYFIVAPIGPSGIAFLGELDKYIPLGRQRIAAVEDDGTLTATISFAENEEFVTLHGYAPGKPVVEGGGPVECDGNMFRFRVAPDSSLRARVTVHL